MINLDDSRHVPVAFASDPVSMSTLRQRAEAQLGILDVDEDAITPEAARRLVHELRVHQIELEMQNDELRRVQDALELSLMRYFDLYELAPVGYLTLNQLGLIQQANLAAARLLETPRIHLLDQPLSRFILPEDQDIHYRHRQQLWSTSERQSYEIRLRQADAEPVWVRLETTLAPEVEGGPPLWRVNLVDISERKRSERDLLDTQERLRLVAEIAELTFWEWDPRTNEVFFPPEWWRQTGYALGELPLRLGEWAALLHPEDRERILACLGCFAAEDHAAPREIQYRLRRKDGIYRWFAARLESIRNGADTVARVLLVHQDVTRRKESEDQAVRLAQHDPLTGLPSRALLDQLANHMLVSARRSGDQLAVLFFDLDRFKLINDTYGHAVGDRLLQSVAQRLRETFRAEDLVTRLGGDEFVVVLARIGGSDDAARAARTAIAALTRAHVIDGLELTCPPSVGISLFPQDGETIDQLIQRADTAMYHAKQISPGQYQFVAD